jgi:cytochrome P450
MKVFLGGPLRDREEAISRAFTDTVRAGTALLRLDIPGGRWHAGLRGRRLLEHLLHEEVPIKRASTSNDLFAALSQIGGAHSGRFTDDDVVNHLIFLLMAAHETCSIALASMCYQLARHLDWQEHLREEVLTRTSAELNFSDLDCLPTIDLVMKESLRLLPPVHVLVRRAIMDTAVLGHYLPTGTVVHVSPWFNHRMHELWADADRFDPRRFSAGRPGARAQQYSWAPYGGGEHKCIGMTFATMQVKAAMFHILRRFKWSVAPDYEMPINTRALPVPADGLPVSLERR